MQIHQVNPTSKRKKKKIIGRGGCHGTYATRGIKGQKARSGGGKGRNFEGTKTPLFRRTPKMRGFNSIYEKNNVVNIYTIQKNFNDGDVVSPRVLRDRNIVCGARRKIKILGNGELTKKITVIGCFVSESAEEKIKKAGGEIREIENQYIS